jgi:PAS domain S-box-containing protein
MAAGAPAVGAVRRSGWPLQAYFAGLALLLLAVAIAAGVVVHVESDNDAQQSAIADANFAAGKAASQLNSSFEFIRQTTEPLVAGQATASLFANPGSCTPLGYAPVGVFDTGHVDLVRTDGSVVCTSSQSKPASAVYAGQPWLAISTPSVIAPTTDPASGNMVAVVAYPIAGLGLLVWFLDLQPIGPKLASEFGSGVDQLEFLVISADGKSIVARSIDSAKWTGVALTGTPFAASADPVARNDVGDTPRWYAQKNVGASGWQVYVGADRAVALATVSRLQQRQLGIITAGLVAVLLGMFIAYRQVALPLASLSAAVRSSRGLDAPAPVPVGGASQVSALGEDINNLISSLKREWNDRERAEQTYIRLFASSPLPIAVTDPTSGMVLEVNPAAETAFGYPSEEFKTHKWRDIYVPRDELELEEMAARRASGTNNGRIGPLSFRKKDGSLMRAVITSYEVDFGGRPARVAMVEDVTEREKYEQQHQQAQRLESLGQLAGGVAHDFNNLLAVILNVTAQLRTQVQVAADDGAEGWDPAIRDLERVDKAAQSASRLTRQLLAFARREVVQRVPIDMSEQIGALMDLLRRTIGSHIVITTSLPADTWPVLMDPGQLEQVIINLAVNSRDAMPKGGHLAITTENVTVDQEYAIDLPGLTPGHYVALNVTDTGAGMDKQTLDHMFEPFFTTKGAGHGTGLGLATVYGIVKQSAGHISITSEPGHGTTATVLIPATDEPVAAAEPVVTVRRQKASGTVLVVEDYADLRDLIEEILKGAGYRVLSSRDGSEALALARLHPGEIDVLLTDVVMPNMLGPDLADQLRRESPGLRVLFMSGHAQPVLGAATSIGRDVQLLQKPFMEGDLLDKLSEVLGAPPPGGTGRT